MRAIVHLVGERWEEENGEKDEIRTTSESCLVRCWPDSTLILLGYFYVPFGVGSTTIVPGQFSPISLLPISSFWRHQGNRSRDYRGAHIPAPSLVDENRKESAHYSNCEVDRRSDRDTPCACRYFYWPLGRHDIAKMWTRRCQRKCTLPPNH